MKLSKLTISLGIYIIIAASFTQQIWQFGEKFIPKTAILIFLALLFIGMTLISLYKGAQKRFSYSRLVFISLICAWAFIFSFRQPYMPEKAHVIEYGLLGWLAFRDLYKGKLNIIACISLASIFVLIIGSLDEVFQFLLPWRVCDIRDVITNFLSGLFGIALFIAASKKTKLS